MLYTTRFGKTINIDIKDFITMTDEELSIIEEREGAFISDDSEADDLQE
jgi:hypothetical protein